MIPDENQINNKLISLGLKANWSLCRINDNCVPKYFFRVIGILDIPECSGITKEEAITKYFKLLEQKK